MKLIPGNSQSIIVTNIKALQNAGYPPERAVAAALTAAGRRKRKPKPKKIALSKKVVSNAPPTPEDYPIANTGFRFGG